MDQKIDQLTNTIANALTCLISEDFGLPIHVFSMSSNGSILVGRYEQSLSHSGLDVEILFEKYCDDAFLVPINLMFIGATGQAARIVIERVGEEGSLQYLS